MGDVSALRCLALFLMMNLMFEEEFLCWLMPYGMERCFVGASELVNEIKVGAEYRCLEITPRRIV